MRGIESENSIPEEYRNWHPELTKTEVETKIDHEPISESELAAESQAILDYVKNSESGDSPEAIQRNIAREFYLKHADTIQQKINEIGSEFGKDDIEEASRSAKAFVDQIRNDSAKFLSDNVDEYFSESIKDINTADQEPDKSKKSKLYRMAIEALDFIPVVGSAKMIAEGVVGKTLSGEQLSKTKRILHTTEGAVFLALDLTGVGIIEAEGMKAGRVVTRSAALMRKMGMAKEAYQPIYKTGRFLIENPAVGKLADQSFDNIIRTRKAHRNSLVEKGKEFLFSTAQEDEGELASAA